ncbi:TonB-dependent receptor [Novosphingobium flavum]|uniref:TonB-dependent receptor n=1 Tax=Novosphingobium flavum TaxID=1778672 RepID=A0A7X1KJY2_9SPHN|nr:TonB-dependent receptor [Novosphingobium flavum]MBC2663942.1 TonB-dependent receptor [Novosphingobium flavum]
MKTYLFLTAALLIASPALAEDVAGTANEEITVVGSGVRQPLDTTGQAISVLGRGELDTIQSPDLTRALERLPGVTVTRNGGLGAFSGLRIRGADSEQTLVLVDGARVADVSSPGSGFDFGTLLASNVERVELLRGANSLVWGSDAIGGVVAVTTRQPEGVQASAEYGAYDSVNAALAAGIKTGGLSLSANGGYARSDGFSQLASDTEADGFKQWQGGLRARVEITPNLSAFADARYARSKVGLDFTFANDYVQTTRQLSGRTGLAYASDVLDLTAAYSIADTHRDYDSVTYGGYGYIGRDEQIDVDGRWRFAPAFALVFGGTHQHDRYEGTYDARKSVNQDSAHALLDYTSGPVNLAAGLRLDHHPLYGDVWTTGANGSVALGSGWRARGSWGEGFKAPTLYQLYGFAGNLALRPERSQSLDAGIEHGNRAGPLHFAATVFRRDSRDLIDYDASANGGWGGYFNVNRARATGFELEGDVRPVAAFQIHAAYSYVESVNRVTGKDLARRPRHALTLAADWTTPLAGLAIGGDIRLVGDSFDNAANTVRLDGYAVAGLRASLPVGEHFELYGRVDNVTDAKYQTVAGYNTPGRSAYIGARTRF